MHLSSCLFSLCSSGLLVTPGVPACLPCLVYSKVFYLSLLLVSCSSFLPAVCTVTEDQTYTERKRRPFTSFSFFVFESFVFLCVCFPQHVSRHLSFRHSLLIKRGSLAGLPRVLRVRWPLVCQVRRTFICPARRLQLTQACRPLISQVWLCK